MYPAAWIGMYEKVQSDNRLYTAYQWISSASDNALVFDVPKVGEWEFRYFPQRSYVDVARCSIHLQGADEMVLSMEEGGSLMRIKCRIQTVDTTKDHVWVGIYRAEEQNNRQYKKYKYISPSSSSSSSSATIEVTFAAPRTPAVYEARLFANKSLVPICKSNSVARS